MCINLVTGLTGALIGAGGAAGYELFMYWYSSGHDKISVGNIIGSAALGGLIGLFGPVMVPAMGMTAEGAFGVALTGTNAIEIAFSCMGYFLYTSPAGALIALGQCLLGFGPRPHKFIDGGPVFKMLLVPNNMNAPLIAMAGLAAYATANNIAAPVSWSEQTSSGTTWYFGTTGCGSAGGSTGQGGSGTLMPRILSPGGGNLGTWLTPSRPGAGSWMSPGAPAVS